MDLQDYIDRRWLFLRFIDHALAAGRIVDDYTIVELRYLEQRIKELQDEQKRASAIDKDSNGE